MSNNPYSDYSPPSGVPMKPLPLRPGGVTVVSILAIVLGVMGLFGVCAGGVGLAAGSFMQGMLTAPAGGANPVQKIQFDLNKELLAINERYMPLHVVMLIGLLVVASWLLVGGIQALRMKSGGRSLLLYAFFATILFELLRTGATAFLQLATLPIYDELARRTGDELGPNMGSAKSMVSMMYGMAIFGMVMVFVWGTAKVVLYGFCAKYLAKPEIVDLFARQTPGSQELKP
ncbi:MAG TPA: hypothetical protein VL096_14840 [Pirellulaceae bacterium]|nr:hypothetical protein [Pirellulaceae bacterium]